MGIVLSHTTARAVYQTAHSIARSGIEPCSDAAIFKSHPSRKLVDDALRWLAIHNVEADENASIETMVFERNGMRNLTGCRTHVSTKRFSSSRFVKLTDGISIVGVELCALQAATYLPFRKLVEYYFELCGAYPRRRAQQPRTAKGQPSQRPHGSNISSIRFLLAMDSFRHERPSSAYGTAAVRPWKQPLS